MTKCLICRAPFTRMHMSQQTCGDEVCRKEWKRQLSLKKAERLSIRKRKEKLKSRSDWMRDAQAAVNAYIHIRDAGQPCISCGNTNPVQWHAGHYLSRGAHPERALDPKNIHRQCSQCNDYLSGNQIQYRKGLISRYGVDYVEQLEAPHDAAKLSIDDLRNTRDHHRALVKNAKKGLCNG